MGNAGIECITTIINNYIKNIYADKKGPDSGDNMEKGHWICSADTNALLPRQQNTSDCGMFTLFFADFILHDLPLNFNQSHMTDLRSKVCSSLLDKKLWYA